MYSNAKSEQIFQRMSQFIRLKRRKLIADGYEVTNIFDLPNFDQAGNVLCAIDQMVIGFEIKKDGKLFNHFFGDKTFIFWDETELVDWTELKDDDDPSYPITTVNKNAEEQWIHIDGNKHPDHYQRILDAAKLLKLQGLVTHDELKSAAHRYILSVHHAYKVKGLNPPKMSATALMR